MLALFFIMRTEAHGIVQLTSAHSRNFLTDMPRCLLAKERPAHLLHRLRDSFFCDHDGSQDKGHGMELEACAAEIPGFISFSLLLHFHAQKHEEARERGC